MTKSELISEVSLNTGVATSDVREAIANAFEIIKKKIAAGEMITIRGFGTFTRKHRAAKTGRNISKGTLVDIPAHDIPFFNPSPEFKDALKK